MHTNSIHKSTIAIIGQAAIFAEAATLSEYWDNILNKIDCITEVPPSRWALEDYFDPDPSAEDKTYCKVGGFIPDIDFNPLEFGLPPNLLEVTDSSQLLGLVVARDAMEDAGYGHERVFDRRRTGVVLGVSGGQKLISDLSSRLQYPIWRKVLLSSGISSADTETIIEKMKLAYAPWNENAFPGLLGNVIAGRIANRLDLGGMNCVADAACASSLAAVRMAVSELVEGRADMMITGGVDTDNSPFTYMCFSKTPAFSPSQKIRPFDQESDGMLIGEGLGMLVLKRLEDAERDADRIYALIQGIGSSSDGRFKSIYAPRSSGQSLAVERAYHEAGFPPPSIGLLEAHGTGTKAGDPAEFTGLKDVFGTPNGNAQTIAIGSVKSNIGHTKAAAGAAGLIKAALALYHKVLPATLNVTQPSSALNITESHFYINTETRPWFRRVKGEIRRAAVSAFGFGGTNYHLVLQEYQDTKPFQRMQTVPQMILICAKTPAALLEDLKSIITELESDDGSVAYRTLIQSSRDLLPDQNWPRLGFVTGSLEEARKFLQDALIMFEREPGADAWDHPKGIIYRARGIGPEEKTVALFPGQGSQYLNMGRELTINFPPVLDAFERMDEQFLAANQQALSRVIFPPPVFSSEELEKQELALRETDYAQAGIGMLSYGIYQLLHQAGFRPDMVAGHSFGELTALWAGGVLTDEAFLRLVKARGKAMRPPEDRDFDSGTMAAVKGSPEIIRESILGLDDVIIANENSPTQVVLAGPSEAIARAIQALTDAGFKVTPLAVSAAFHTPLVAHASQYFARAVKEEEFREPHICVYSNTTSKPYPPEASEAREILSNHILHPVVFKTQVEEIYANGGRLFVEIGPRNVLGNLVKDILLDRPHTVISVNPSRDKSDDRQFREAALKLRVVGLPLQNLDPYQLASQQI